MRKPTSSIEAEPVKSPREVLTEVLHSGAQRMLAAALEDEVASYLAESRAAQGAMTQATSCAEHRRTRFGKPA